MTFGNILDFSFFGVLNLISAYTCYKYYYPEGYVNKKPQTKKVVLLRWSRILASCCVGFIHIVYWSGVKMLGNIVEFINLPWSDKEEDTIGHWLARQEAIKDKLRGKVHADGTPVEGKPHFSNIPPITPPKPIKL